MTRIILFNKPYGVISQFSPQPPYSTLADYVTIPRIYPAGRLDTDIEGLLILTDNGLLQSFICEPKYQKNKLYWVQVEGVPDAQQLQRLRCGVALNDFTTAPAQVRIISEPKILWPRNPPIRYRQTVATSWLELTITEGKNRQVRRMTAKVGLPTLRLIRYAIGGIELGNLPPGNYCELKYNDFKRWLEKK